MGRRINRICEIKYPSRVEGWLDVCGKYTDSTKSILHIHEHIRSFQISKIRPTTHN